MISDSEFLKNNEEMLEKMKNGEIEGDKINTGIGSFMMCIFRDENYDAIPLFFDFLSFKTGKDYTEEKNVVDVCLKEGLNEFEEYEAKIMNSPLGALLSAMCDG